MTAFGDLVGVGLYTPAEAARLVGVGAAKITRWLRGHEAHGKSYAALWAPQIDLDDGHVYLGFRDLMEVRVADAFIRENLSSQKVRRAIEIARDLIGEERPLSTARFRTDGRSVFLQALKEDGSEDLIDLFKNQFAFRTILEPSLRNIEFSEDGNPARWWPLGKAGHVLVDPERSFGKPVEAGSGVPTSALAAAVVAEGSEEKAAKVWGVPRAAIRRAVEFEQRLAA